jgi:hypothetical protein
LYGLDIITLKRKIMNFIPKRRQFPFQFINYLLSTVNGFPLVEKYIGGKACAGEIDHGERQLAYVPLATSRANSRLRSGRPQG